MGMNSEHLDKKYGYTMKVGENIREMRKQFMNALNNKKMQE